MRPETRVYNQQRSGKLMRGLVCFLTLALGVVSNADGQSSVRVESPRHSQPGRPVSPQTPGVSTVKPGKPDARLGAGGVRPYTGNILYPGTPNGGRPGNILSPGIPTVVQPVPSVVQPAQDRRSHDDADHGRNYHRGRRFSGAYPVYGFYPFVPNVIAVTGNTVAGSSSGYVVTVGEDGAEAAGQPPPAEQTDPEYWLIALRGGLIYAVSGYAVEERAFRFVTLQGDEYVVPLAELDREFTSKLNRDRGVAIELD